MAYSVVPITSEDIAIICNSINDEGTKYVPNFNRQRSNQIIEWTLKQSNTFGYKIEKKGSIVAFFVYKVKPSLIVLEHFFIAGTCRYNRSIYIPLCTKLVELLKGLPVYYNKLHEEVDTVTKYANNNYINLVQLEKDLERIKLKYGK